MITENTYTNNYEQWLLSQKIDKTFARIFGHYYEQPSSITGLKVFSPAIEEGCS